MNGRRRILLAAAAAGAAVAAISLSRAVAPAAATAAAEANAPWGRALVAARRAAAVVRDGLFRGASAAARRDELAAEVDALRAAAVAAEALRLENARLRREAGFASPAGSGGVLVASLGGRLVACDVLSAGGSDPWRIRLVLSRGTRDGIAPGQTVLSPEGLVGRIVSASATSSEVMPLCDSESRVAVEIRTRSGAPARAVLSGSGFARGDRTLEALRVASPFTADWIGMDAEVARGDRVFTSGLGGVYPPGVAVGRVVDAERDETRLWQRARVAPNADFPALPRVFVLVPGDGGGR